MATHANRLWLAEAAFTAQAIAARNQGMCAKTDVDCGCCTCIRNIHENVAISATMPRLRNRYTSAKRR